jgi:hypothetical protein
MYRHAMPSRVDELWNAQKKKLQLQFPMITDKDLHFETGRKHEMMEKIRVKLGKSEAEMKFIFQSL